MGKRAHALRVLLVDDEPGVRGFAKMALSSAGYEVEEAADAAEAIARVREGLEFDVLVADLKMPNSSGADMVRDLRAIRDDFKVLYATGFIDSLMDARPLLQDEAFLEKPYTSQGLREAVSLLAFGRIVPEAETKS